MASDFHTINIIVSTEYGTGEFCWRYEARKAPVGRLGCQRQSYGSPVDGP